MRRRPIAASDIALITRTSTLDDMTTLEPLISVAAQAGLHMIYIITSTNDGKDYQIEMSGLQVQVLHSNTPTSPTVPNIALAELAKQSEKPCALLVVSKEVEISTTHILRMQQSLADNPDLLVAGYRFEIHHSDKPTEATLRLELETYYNDAGLEAFQIPWNTCALWNYELFDTYIQRFDSITENGDEYQPISVTVDGQTYQTAHVGMEDGLAIAKAKSLNPRLSTKLLVEHVPWRVHDALQHRLKIARKEQVMEDYMTARHYNN